MNVSLDDPNLKTSEVFKIIEKPDIFVVNTWTKTKNENLSFNDFDNINMENIKISQYSWKPARNCAIENVLCEG